MSAVVRSTARPDLIARLIDDEIRAMDGNLPVTIGPFGDRIARLNERARFNTALLALFAGIGVLLAGSRRLWDAGVPGLPAGARDWREDGAGSYAWPDCSVGSGSYHEMDSRGPGAGVAGAFAAAREYRSMLYQVAPGDPWTLSAVTILLAAVSAIATYVPARRAATLALPSQQS